MFEFTNINGTFTDNGTNTKYLNAKGDDLRSQMGAICPEPSLITISGGNLATNVATGNFFVATGDANYTFTNPTNSGTGGFNAKSYQPITWRINQTAGRTVAFGTDWRFNVRNLASADLITFLASYTGMWYFTAVCNAADAKWDITDVFIVGLGNKLLGATTFTGQVLAPDGSGSAPGLSFASGTGTGFYRIGTKNIGVNGDLFRVHETGMNFGGSLAINWYTGGAFAAVSSTLCRKANSVLAIYDEGANTAQEFRVYGDATKYASLSHNGTNALLNASSGSLLISTLPTANPGAGILWNNAGTPAIGT